ncbi:MAG: 50S ribosomal protein L11 methyltransferase [Acidobacteria bacterium]|nr:50S ribosomal protein L11 methyltransferase [Acidobacteriota bacterium]
MFSLYVECAEQEAEYLSAELWEEGATGVQEDALPGERCLLRAWFEDPNGLTERFSEYQPRIEAEPEIDWEAACRQAWQPFDVGARLHLAPEWDENPTPRGRLRLTIHPGQALGSGAHPATQLCLAALEAHLRPGDTVLDVGTGSGILTSAAVLLGAGCAVGCDIEFHSVQIAKSNLISDGVAPLVFTGSTRAMRGASVDTLVANINAVTHEAIAHEYARVCRRTLVVSGFPDRAAARVKAALKEAGFKLSATFTDHEWVCLVLCKEDRS